MSRATSLRSLKLKLASSCYYTSFVPYEGFFFPPGVVSLHPEESAFLNKYLANSDAGTLRTVL